MRTTATSNPFFSKTIVLPLEDLSSAREGGDNLVSSRIEDPTAESQASADSEHGVHDPASSPSDGTLTACVAYRETRAIELSSSMT